MVLILYTAPKIAIRVDSRPSKRENPKQVIVGIENSEVDWIAGIRYKFSKAYEY